MLVVIDLDGVVYLGKELIRGAAETIAEIRRRGHRICFLTNNSALTRDGFRQRLSRFGIGCRRDEIMSSGYATANFLKKRGEKGNIFVIGGEGLAREMEGAGFDVVTRNRRKIDYVVVGMDRRFNYRDLCTAQQAILEGALFVATNADPVYPAEKGVLPGAGVMVSAIETATGAAPILIGKPNPFILKEILRETKTSPGKTILVGDRLDSDVFLGKRCGVKTVLVLTGITKPANLKRIKSGERPDYVIKSIEGLLKIKKIGL